MFTVETQRRLEYTRQKLVRIEQMNEQLRKVRKLNKANEEKLERLVKRRDSLEKDAQRLAHVAMQNEVGLESELLRAFDNDPRDMEMICAEQFKGKMSQLKVLLNEIIVRTCFNEKAMCSEIGHQESEFELRLNEAIQQRKTETLKSEKAQEKAHTLLIEQANLYEDVRKLEENKEKFDASRWLLNVEKRRLSDILDRTRRDPKLGTKKCVPEKLGDRSTEQVLTSEASLSHSHMEEDFDFHQPVEQQPSSEEPRSKDSAEEVNFKPARFLNINKAISTEACRAHRSSRTDVLKSPGQEDLDSMRIMNDEIDEIPNEPGRKMQPIPVSNSLTSQKPGKVCPVHGNLKKVEENDNKMPNMNGIDLMKLISQVIEKEYGN